MRTGSINLTIDSQFQNVFLVGLAVQRICSSIPSSDQFSYEMEMAVVEAVNNSIEHACHNQPGHPITMRMNLSEDRITFVISDAGEAVESLREMPALDAAVLAHPPERGRGVQMMRAVMDEVVYRTDGTVNCLTLVKYLPIVRAGGA
jgi:serine/threonine-protein kinase RsbW